MTPGTTQDRRCITPEKGAFMSDNETIMDDEQDEGQQREQRSQQGGQRQQGQVIQSGNQSDGRRKPQFDEEQNRWIGARFAREEDKRRAIEGERDALKAEKGTLETRLSTLERDLRTTRAENAVLAAATKLGAGKPELVWRQVKDDLDYDDEGKPKDVDSVVTKAKQAYPELFGVRAASGADGGKGGDTGDTLDMNAFIRQGARSGKTVAHINDLSTLGAKRQ